MQVRRVPLGGVELRSHWRALPNGKRRSPARLALVVELTVVSSNPVLFWV